MPVSWGGMEALSVIMWEGGAQLWLIAGGEECVRGEAACRSLRVSGRPCSRRERTRICSCMMVR